MSILLVLLACIIICAVDIPELMKIKQRRETIAFLGFFIPGVVLGIMVSLNMPLPNPINGIEYLVQPIKQVFLHLWDLFPQNMI